MKSKSVIKCLGLAAVFMLWVGCYSGYNAHHRTYQSHKGVYKTKHLELKHVEKHILTGATEVWIIEKTTTSVRTVAPASFEAVLHQPQQTEIKVPLPLQKTEVKATVSGFVSSVSLTQKYENIFNEKIEAVYSFPLPSDAAVTEFVMHIGERKIVGIIREKEEAEKIYNQARSQGFAVSMLTQERPNIFTQKIANIEPGKQIDIEMTYFHTLAFSKGEYEFVFPMIVGPRFNPPSNGDSLNDPAILSNPKNYLKTNEISTNTISVDVDWNCGVSIEKLYSSSHAIEKKKTGENRYQIQLSKADSIPNKDFVLRCKVRGQTLETAMMTSMTKNGGHFAFMLQPPQSMSELKRVPREMIFVLDCSGSMGGKPIAQAKSVIRHCLKRLNGNDSFQIIRFSNNASQLGPVPLKASRTNLKRGLAYLDKLNSTGGTMMIEGVKAALDFPHDDSRFRIVTFLTDGYIGNEAEIFKAVNTKLGSSRIFSFGVGDSVNRYLLAGLAQHGHGAVAYVGLKDNPIPMVDEFYERATRPALTDVSIDWGNMKVSNVQQLKGGKDLFAGRPVLLTGKYQGSGEQSIRIRGKMGNKDIAYTVNVDLDKTSAKNPAIEHVWARARLKTLMSAYMLMDQRNIERIDLKKHITDFSIDHKVMSQFTAFLAMDSSRRTDGKHGTTIIQRIAVPDGVKYETTIGE